MLRQDVKIGMEVIMTGNYCSDVTIGKKYKIIKQQVADSDCFVVDHDGEESYLAPYCSIFEPVKPTKINSVDLELQGGNLVFCENCNGDMQIQMDDVNEYAPHYKFIDKDEATQIIEHLQKEFNLNGD